MNRIGNGYILQPSIDCQTVRSFTVSVRLSNFHSHQSNIMLEYQILLFNLNWKFQFRSLRSNFTFKFIFLILVANFNFVFEFEFPFQTIIMNRNFLNQHVSIVKFHLKLLFNFNQILHEKGNANENILQSRADCQVVHTMTFSRRLRIFQCPSISILQFSKFNFLFKLLGLPTNNKYA